MDLTLKTNRGGVVSIHFGSIITTNLWYEKGWYEITDPGTIIRLKTVKHHMDNGNVNEANTTAMQIRIDLPNPDTIGKPYRRNSNTTRAGAPLSSGNQAGPTYAENGEPENQVGSTFKKNVAARIIKFFSEFTFDPAIRFVNTLAHVRNYKAACSYVSNYMQLCDHPDKDSITEKMKSDEFKMLIGDLLQCSATNKVNNRLEIFYGPAGTGKTTAAIKKYPNAKITVCNNNMEPSDLLKVFSFNDENGNPVFKPTSLQEDMINGNPHILDEINLLPTSTLRFLQGMLDGKKEFEYEDKIITIADGFKIIGTMNLIVNGQVYSLPEPIVDRADSLECYEVNADILADYAF